MPLGRKRDSSRRQVDSIRAWSRLLRRRQAAPAVTQPQRNTWAEQPGPVRRTGRAPAGGHGSPEAGCGAGSAGCPTPRLGWAGRAGSPAEAPRQTMRTQLSPLSEPPPGSRRRGNHPPPRTGPGGQHGPQEVRGNWLFRREGPAGTAGVVVRPSPPPGKVLRLCLRAPRAPCPPAPSQGAGSERRRRRSPS
ncbi:hypothetical protein QYF61_005183 [Mycteria americana]|uniref:Uncharacterized protein n=1 Tax=Mycteria americana TaxID=33587 RepID=A0AAN7NQ86_MYCAM|nr:hypothetical protein QYF61_005183 [Mycteria americana]